MSDVDKPFVETVRIQNFGCARDVTLELTRLHALIGPNDSGKSTVLSAIRTACELIRLGEHELAKERRLDPRGVEHSSVTVVSGDLRLTWMRGASFWILHRDQDGATQFTGQHFGPISQGLADFARGATLIRWDPDAIRRGAELIPEGRPLVVGPRGEGLPAVYEAILSRDRSAFGVIEASLRQHFSTVKGIWLPTSADSKKALGVTLNSGTRVHADQLSEGMLYWLAFAVLPYVDPTAVLLVEEPENGLHPSRIAEVVKVLREVSKRTQVILATHSPLVINELEPDEVTILTRDDKAGTRAKRIDRTPHFHQRQQVYALGELWLSFADGVDEAALVSDGGTKPAE